MLGETLQRKRLATVVVRAQSTDGRYFLREIGT
jgi:hypothetical protein